MLAVPVFSQSDVDDLQEARDEIEHCRFLLAPIETRWRTATGQLDQTISEDLVKCATDIFDELNDEDSVQLTVSNNLDVDIAPYPLRRHDADQEFTLAHYLTICGKGEVSQVAGLPVLDHRDWLPTANATLTGIRSSQYRRLPYEIFFEWQTKDAMLTTSTVSTAYETRVYRMQLAPLKYTIKEVDISGSKLESVQYALNGSNNVEADADEVVKEVRIPGLQELQESRHWPKLAKRTPSEALTYIDAEIASQRFYDVFFIKARRDQYMLLVPYLTGFVLITIVVRLRYIQEALSREMPSAFKNAWLGLVPGPTSSFLCNLAFLSPLIFVLTFGYNNFSWSTLPGLFGVILPLALASPLAVQEFGRFRRAVAELDTTESNDSTTAESAGPATEEGCESVI